METKSLSAAIERVYQKLSAVSEEEFRRRLEEHAEGDIANIIIETKALEARELKAKSLDDYSYTDRLDMCVPVDNTIFYYTPEMASTSIPITEELFDPSIFKTMRSHFDNIYHWTFGQFRLASSSNEQLFLWDNYPVELQTIRYSSLSSVTIVNHYGDDIIPINKEAEDFDKWLMAA